MNELENIAMQLHAVRQFAGAMDFINAGPSIGERGWAVPYLMIGDDIWLNGRWSYWYETIEAGKLLDRPIPKIQFLDSPNHATLKHLNDLIDMLAEKGFVWNAVEYILDECLWALAGVNEGDDPPRELFEGSRQWFCKHIGFHLLQQYPYDYWAEIIQDQKGRGKHWNPTAFFATPMPVATMMARMSIGDTTNWKARAVESASDPCCGTGRMLMEASNYLLQLSGQDVDGLVVKAAKVNAFLYMPWMARPASGRIKEIKEHNEQTKDTPPRTLAYDPERGGWKF